MLTACSTVSPSVGWPPLSWEQSETVLYYMYYIAVFSRFLMFPSKLLSTLYLRYIHGEEIAIG